MKRLPLAIALSAGAFAALPRTARAQIDVNPPLPNVLILLDTSGSMENMLDNNPPETESATCAYSFTGGTIGSVTVNNAVALTGTPPNKWGIAMQALTGSMSPYNCVSMPRDANSYLVQEYSIDGHKPYDNGYFYPFHRPVVGTDLGLDAASACVVAPGWLPGDISGGVGNPMKGCTVGSCAAGAGGLATDYPAGSITTRLLNGNAGACAFSQFQDGILDSARDMLRFGLMTYDQDPAAGVGVAVPSYQVANTPNSPFDGNWSYFPGWNTGATPLEGKPADCSTLSIFEVGSRNPAAPPWEGRFIQFPTPTATIAQVEAQNAQVQQTINALRMYGATPTAGMFADAQYYFQSDPAGPLGSPGDPYVQGNCRSQYIIHITDGVPNQDLRPACSQSPVDPTKPGQCPYQLPEQTAFALANSTHPVQTFVIGFAISKISGVDCHTVSPFDAKCTSGDPTYSACCELQKIAYSGGTTSAYFADTPGDLSAALNAIIATIAKNVTTRTVPAYAPSISSNSNQKSVSTNSSLYLSSFTPLPGKPWSGNVQRERFQCSFGGGTYTVPPPVIDPIQGDDFGVNLNLPGTQGNRQFRTVLATPVGATYPSDGTIRPNISNASLPGVHGNDLLGVQGGTLVGVTAGNILTLPPAALNIGATSCPNTLNTEWLTTNACRDLALNFVMAQPSTDPMPDATFTPFQPRTGYALGAIYHSTPAIIGPPSANLPDESYQAFASQASVLNRKTVLYTASIDGLLHAFDINVSTSNRTNGELWSFIPPGVLDALLSTYPGANPMLLDGAPAVKDVVFDRSKGSGSLLLASNWHTALVAGFGQNHRGYYALDVTDPSAATALTAGPQFLWQLTSMPTYKGIAQTELFGQHSATPAITTVFADLDGSGAHEIGVAILPGGSDSGAVSGVKCARDGSTVTNDAEPSAGAFASRGSVQCWAAAGQPVVGRSLTIARLDTGEILRVFGRKVDLPAAIIAANRVGAAETPLDSPMTGIPVVYPSDPGAVAQKVFIGDADGTVWRFDLTDTNPQNWTGKLFLDTYNTVVDTSSTSWQEGQPIQIAPVVAVDSVGAVVVGIATGDQETYTNSGKNFIYSITEKPDTTNNILRANVNWYFAYQNGERVSGPMTIFDSVFYWATFTPAAASAACSNGTPYIWGVHYEQATSGTPSLGGVPRLPSATLPYVDPTVSDPTLVNKIIPGVSINASPACADTSQTVTDQYTGSSHTMASYVTPGSYSLFAQVGGKNTSGNGAANATYTLKLPTPQTQAVVDSWAAIVE